jgi:putative addiction module component (TIGR02574 family)
MSPSAKKILEDALHLDEAERASVAGALIESLHPDPQPGADEAWERVIERRVRELEAGTAETIPWSEVRARLFSGLE